MRKINSQIQNNIHWIIEMNIYKIKIKIIKIKKLYFLVVLRSH